MDDTKEAGTSEVQTPEIDPKALMEQLETLKKVQAGSDKAYSEAARKATALEAELEKMRKEKMSEKEKAEYELKQKEIQLEQKSREVAEATLRFSKMQVLGEKKVPLEFAEYIGGANEDEIRANADTFLKRFNEAVGKGVTEKLAGTTKPVVGNEPAKQENLSGISFKEMERLARDGKL
jgi:hypothetical protein